MEDKKRCSWCLSDPLYIKYHDEEWGKIIRDEKKLFEALSLESAQSGLSWITILKKRENYRRAFHNFDYNIVATYDDEKVEELLKDSGIVRHRMKIKATINNAQRFMEIQKEYGTFFNYLWGFVDGKQIVNSVEGMEDLVGKSELSDKVVKDLKRKGFKFLGTTTVYSFLQAVGVIDDHLNSCKEKGRS